MQQVIFIIYYTIIIAAMSIGAINYQRLDKALRIIVLLLVAISISELLSFIAIEFKKYALRYLIYHVYSVIEVFLQTLFFIYAIKPRNIKQCILLSTWMWPAIGLLNMLFLQPWNQLNTNMLMFESFATITMCLYFIYWLVKEDVVKNIFRHSHFIVAILLLLLWSGTFFFWAFVKVLYKHYQSFYYILDYAQNIINIVVYGGIGAVLFFYKPLKLRTVENR